ncbi:MAG: hypothetical protein IAE91_07635, partial [Ignavibacteriaceae bacterium]|nr:hypothetical protein [Ignavibacteriaceae bacterium]
MQNMEANNNNNSNFENNNSINSKSHLMKRLLESSDKANKRQTANKILDAITKLENNQNYNSKRRWVWELIQNAKDLKINSNGVAVQINLNETTKELIFSHNGMNFDIDQITFLVNQVSTKDRSSDSETTGKFGTGFLSTHLLSKTVSINGILTIDERDSRKFNILLDRDAKTPLEMETKVEKAQNDRLGILDNPSIDTFIPEALNTSFTYHLNDSSYKFAEEGINDLEISLPFTMVFVPAINSVTIPHKNLKFERNGIQELGGIKIHNIIENQNGNRIFRHIAIVSEGDVNVSIELEKDDEGKFCVKKLPESLPRLFCEFPLVGSECIPLPFVINSKRFNPTEPRDGIYLTENATEACNENKELMSIAVELIISLLHSCSEQNLGNLFYLAEIAKPAEQEWLSSRYYKESVFDIVYNSILHTPLVRNFNGDLVAFYDANEKVKVYIPKISDKHLKDFYWLLSQFDSEVLNPSFLPHESELAFWSKIKLPGDNGFNLIDLAKLISSTENKENLEQIMPVNEASFYNNLNLFYDLLFDSQDSYHKIRENYSEFNIFLNQNGDLKNIKDLSIDANVPEIVKKSYSILGHDIAAELLDVNLICNHKNDFKEITQEYILTEISNIFNNKNNVYKGFKYTDEELINCALFLTSYFNPAVENKEERSKINGFTNRFLDGYEFLETDVDFTGLRTKADRIIFENILTKIQDAGNIDSLAEVLDSEEDKLYNELQNLAGFILDSDYESMLTNKQKSYAIIPNRNGEFCKLDTMFFENTLGDELIDIIQELGRDLKSELIHEFINLNLDSGVKIFTLKDAADEIEDKIMPLMLKISRTQEES